MGVDSCKLGCINWYLFFLILFGIIFFVVVMFILIVDLDVFIGCLNVWLFLYYVMKLLILENFEFNFFMEFLIFLSKVKVEFWGNLCVVECLDEVDKLMLMYIVLFFCMLMIILFFKFVRRFLNCCFSRFVIVFFCGVCIIFVFCYMDIINIFFNIFCFVKFELRIVVFYNGDIECFYGKYIFYGIIVLVFIIVFVILFFLIFIF